MQKRHATTGLLNTNITITSFSLIVITLTNLRFSVEFSTHGVRLSGSRLAVREAGGHSTLEDVLDEGSRGISGK